MAHRFEGTSVVEPTRIRWTEDSKNLITVSTGGYALERPPAVTRETMHNEFAAHGLGQLLVGFAAKAAQDDADPMVARIKRAVEERVPAAG